MGKNKRTNHAYRTYPIPPKGTLRACVECGSSSGIHSRSCTQKSWNDREENAYKAALGGRRAIPCMMSVRDKTRRMELVEESKCVYCDRSAFHPYRTPCNHLICAKCIWSFNSKQWPYPHSRLSFPANAIVGPSASRRPSNDIVPILANPFDQPPPDSLPPPLRYPVSGEYRLQCPKCREVFAGDEPKLEKALIAKICKFAAEDKELRKKMGGARLLTSTHQLNMYASKQQKQLRYRPFKTPFGWGVTVEFGSNRVYGRSRGEFQRAHEIIQRAKQVASALLIAKLRLPISHNFAWSRAEVRLGYEVNGKFPKLWRFDPGETVKEAEKVEHSGEKKRKDMGTFASSRPSQPPTSLHTSYDNSSPITVKREIIADTKCITVNQQDLLDKARAGLALSAADCPDSKIHVSAVLVCEDGTIVHGVKVESASYGGTICAERSALIAAVFAGYRKFKSITVVTNLDKPASPCGLCRQFMVEFGDYEVVMGGANGTVEVMSTYQLLPLAFTPASLDEFNSQPSK